MASLQYKDYEIVTQNVEVKSKFGLQCQKEVLSLYAQIVVTYCNFLFPIGLSDSQLTQFFQIFFMFQLGLYTGAIYAAHTGALTSIHKPVL